MWYMCAKMKRQKLFNNPLADTLSQDSGSDGPWHVPRPTRSRTMTPAITLNTKTVSHCMLPRLVGRLSGRTQALNTNARMLCETWISCENWLRKIPSVNWYMKTKYMVDTPQPNRHTMASSSKPARGPMCNSSKKFQDRTWLAARLAVPGEAGGGSTVRPGIGPSSRPAPPHAVASSWPRVFCSCSWEQRTSTSPESATMPVASSSMAQPATRPDVCIASGMESTPVPKAVAHSAMTEERTPPGTKGRRSLEPCEGEPISGISRDEAIVIWLVVQPCWAQACGEPVASAAPSPAAAPAGMAPRQ
mmetsp:Transcript_1253/g.2891  ORF Transcript_1253/g.2891 Transcript_1253/m.2891 type:complete len:304 (-) Transcript_1253:36-947(-)